MQHKADFGKSGNWKLFNAAIYFFLVFKQNFEQIVCQDAVDGYKSTLMGAAAMGRVLLAGLTGLLMCVFFSLISPVTALVSVISDYKHIIGDRNTLTRKHKKEILMLRDTMVAERQDYIDFNAREQLYLMANQGIKQAELTLKRCKKLRDDLIEGKTIDEMAADKDNPVARAKRKDCDCKNCKKSC